MEKPVVGAVGDRFVNGYENLTIVVWSSDWTETTGQAIVTRRVVEHQAGVRWIQASYGKAGIRSIFGVFGAIGRMYAALLTRKTRIVYLVCSRSTIGFLRDVPALVTSLTGARVVIHVHGSDIVDLLSNSPLAGLATALYSRCEIIVPSKHLIAPLQTLCRGKIFLCENFAPKLEVDELVTEPEASVPLVVWNSNIMASKGFFDVADAVRLARIKRPDLSLMALGRPLTDAEMTAEAAQAALEVLCRENWFTYLGTVPTEMAFRYTGKANIIVFPSRYRSECQPLSIVQAMCLGRPLLLRDTPALRATVGNYPATLLPNSDIQQMASSILETINSEPPTGIEEAAAQAEARFSPKRFDHVMANILRRASSR